MRQKQTTDWFPWSHRLRASLTLLDEELQVLCEIEWYRCHDVIGKLLRLRPLLDKAIVTREPRGASNQQPSTPHLGFMKVSRFTQPLTDFCKYHDLGSPRKVRGRSSMVEERTETI